MPLNTVTLPQGKDFKMKRIFTVCLLTMLLGLFSGALSTNAMAWNPFKKAGEKAGQSTVKAAENNNNFNNPNSEQQNKAKKILKMK